MCITRLETVRCKNSLRPLKIFLKTEALKSRNKKAGKSDRNSSGGISLLVLFRIRFRAKREQLKGFNDCYLKANQNLALTVLYVPYSLGSSPRKWR